MEHLQVDGKFLRCRGERVFLKMVTYGPFPGGWGEEVTGDFTRIKEAGFNAVRLYQWPTPELLDAAEANALWVFAGLEWDYSVDFLASGEWRHAERNLVGNLESTAKYSALTGVFVANEVPSDLVRWLGPDATRSALERLVDRGKEARPDLIWAYANYPGTEYLELDNADLTAMNVYLENQPKFVAYLQRLHHLAGDRPVIISEFGLDTARNGLDAQAETFQWAIRSARAAGIAGFTAYAWSDRWWNADTEVLDWDFGLTARDGSSKPSLDVVKEAFAESSAEPTKPTITVVICTRNGVERIAECLTAVIHQSNPPHQVIVVDDGSTDGTGDLVARQFREVMLIALDHVGLSAARNVGADSATGEVLVFTDDDCRPDFNWLEEMANRFESGWDAVGGPNLPPLPDSMVAAVIAAAPGAPSHVMLDDQEAEHIPGCNLAVRRSTYYAVGGFDCDFWTAGDDVDFCWRLRDAGFRIGFAPNAFVWHHRRQTIRSYFRQQAGYGTAEALLRRKHPRRFSPSGDAIWHGVIYAGGPVQATDDAVIYYGKMGLAGYQSVVTKVQPRRAIESRFSGVTSKLLLTGLEWLAPRLRSWRRIARFRGPLHERPQQAVLPNGEFFEWSDSEREVVLRDMLDQGWHAGAETGRWDLEKEGTRLLIATERGRTGIKRHLFRVWGNPETFLRTRRCEPLERGIKQFPASQ